MSRKLSHGERFMRDVKATRARAEAEDRQVREALAGHLMASWAIVEDALGLDEAKELWQSIPPKPRRGHAAPPEKTERDTLALLVDYGNRHKGMTAEESAVAMAGHHGLSEDPQNARRTLDRLWASERGQLIERTVGSRETVIHLNR